ncbi:MAG TPA: PP2C family protein-serine/threonine phosphatase [Thermoanaerobaculia bacterium]|nr:PP2C family protein-serine/threonine phosphatase [Thermoanaerobaculia bacterium]
MLRRIPWAPLLFGVFSAWALLSMLAVGRPEIGGLRVYVIVGGFGGAMMLLLYLVAQLIPRRDPRSLLASAGCGCAYGAAGFLFVLPVAMVVAILTGRGIVIEGVGPGLLVVTAYTGLGILAGVWYSRFVRTEEERRRAALAAQAAEFAQQQLALARDLQQRLLPPARLEHALYSIEARNVPATFVAGDFYDFIPLAGERLLIVVADVAGKGVGAGLIMATTKGIIPLLAAEERHVAPLAGRLNDRLAAQLSKRDFVAAILAMFDPETGELSIANAGLPDPVVVAPGGSIRAVGVPGPRYPLGVRAGLSYESVTLKMAPGERVLFFTDGLPELDAGGEPLGYERLHAEIAASRGDLTMLFERLAKAARGTHDDDWTAVALERLTPARRVTPPPAWPAR